MPFAFQAFCIIHPRLVDDAALSDRAFPIPSPSLGSAIFLSLYGDNKTARHHGVRAVLVQTISLLASATSMESPSWFRMSSPVSGMSPEVDWLTAIFLAISDKQAI